MTPSSSGRVTPRERLASSRARLSRALYTAIARLGLTQAEVADACGTSPQKVQLWCDHHRPEAPTLAHLELMPRELAAAMSDEALRALDFHVADHSSDSVSMTSEIECVCSVMERGGEVHTLLARTLSSAEPRTSAERRELREKAQALRAACSAFIKRLDDEDTAERALFSRDRGEA
jgi:transcriptional regulator with XRE-family HTH domain